MKKNIIIIISILVVIILSVLIMQLTPKIVELKIESEINKANYCNIDSDCKLVGDKCPFDCYIYVNNNEFDRISKIVESYNSKCVYGCILCESVKCENKTCIPVCEK